ncbi:twin-arginine translocase subunit TatC [Tumebacillus sp. ITR2]|uniref:Sec-independent protein translocase protein TatC n=1 Tax=Tumebacillus amylolyticus TaxID=2801339 RepID=A0ABS1JG13_9BACL|nr:twin-arginine translocase subunit TatC [Tumebacillus amylolyticus]MBL0389211.1 twin-arginine translocase subunit TatC [Tumebacillus amylolyticus]
MSQEEQPLVSHLSELRKRIIWVLVIFLINLIITFVFVDPIYNFLVNDANRLFPEMGPIKLTVLGPGEILKVYFTVAGMAAIGLTLPFLLYHVWKFISPALEEREAKVAFRYIPLVLGMFLAGISFGYFLVFPLLYKFLYELGSSRFTISYTASNYFSFLNMMVVPFGLIFEMPVAVMFLSRIGILAPQTLVKVRKYAYFVMVIIASMISPPELTSHLAVATPMILLYEISIVISKWSWRKRQAMLAEQAAQFE